MYNIYITLLSILVVSSLSTDTDNITTYNGNFTKLPFRLVSPEEGLLTIYYSEPPTLCSVILYANPSIEGLEIFLESSNMKVATVDGDVTLSPCQESNLTVTSNSSLSPSYKYTEENVQDKCYNITFYGTPIYIGYSIVRFFATYNSSNDIIYVGEVLLRSIRVRTILNDIFDVSVTFIVVVVSLAMGIDVKVETIKEHLKRPKAPIIAMTSQFVTMPLLAYSIIYIMGYTGATALGFFAFGCSPGGGNSNMYSKLLNGDMSVSVTLTTLSTIAALGMLPLWLYTLGRTLPADEGMAELTLPFLSILQSLAFLIVPIIIGVIIKYKLPRVANVMKKCLKVFFVLAITYFLTFGLYINRFIFLGWNAHMLLTACMLPYSGYIFGALLAWICCLNWTLIKTVSLETGMQNVSLCILIVQSVAAQPDSDLAILLPVTASIVTSWPFFLTLPVYLGRQRILNKRKAKLEAESKASDSQSDDQVKISVDVNDDQVKISVDANDNGKENAEEKDEVDVEMKLMTT